MGPVDEEWVETNPDGTTVIHHRQRYDKRLLIPQIIGLAVIGFVLLGVWAVSFRRIPVEVERVMETREQAAPADGEQILVGQDGKRYIVITRENLDPGGA